MPEDALRRRAARRPRVRAAVGLGAAGRHGVHRRRHAQPVLAPPSIDRLLSGIRARVPLAPDAEITLEANPGTFEREKFAGFRAAGVNRLSLGIQSFDPAHLRALGRIHDERRGARAPPKRRSTIFGNVNFDLMYALPRQTVDEARADARRGARVRAAAPVVLPPHARAQHAVPPPSAAAARRGRGGRHRGRRRTRRSPRAGYVHYETSALRAARPRVPRTTSTTGASATISASAPARIRSCRFRTASCARCAGSNRSSTCEQVARRRAAAWRMPKCPATTSASSSC